MARDYSPTYFFLRVPNKLLGRFFHERHGALGDIDFDSLHESKEAAEIIHQAATSLTDSTQSVIEAECREIESMAFHGGITALIEEATNHPHFDLTFPEAINRFDGEYGKAMWTYLEHPQYWRPATSILHAQNIADSFWRRRNDLPGLTPLVEPHDANRLGEELKKYFQAREGRGRHARVDVFRREAKEYFFAYLSDFGQSDAEWTEATLSLRPRLPAFEIIFVYSRSEGTLDLYAPRNTKYAADLQKIFARTIFELDDLKNFDAIDGAYPFDKFADRDFVFKYPSDGSVVSVVIRRLRLSLLGNALRRVIIEADVKNQPKAVYDVMERLKLPPFHVTQVEIAASFSTAIPGTRTKGRTFTLSYPDWCNLRHEGRDQILRQMLADSGIELTERSSA